MARVWVRRRSDRQGRPWVCAWEGSDGKRHQETFPTEDEAQRHKAKLTLEGGQAVPLAPVDRDVSVRAFGEKWLTEAAPGLKRKTVRSYQDTLDHHVYPALGAFKVREVHQQHVSAFLTAKVTAQDAGRPRFKPGTVRLMYATIRRLLARAMFEGIVTVNAASKVWKELPVPAKHKRKPGRMTKDQVKAFDERQLAAFLAAADHRHHALFLTMARTGLRIGEALAPPPERRRRRRAARPPHPGRRRRGAHAG